MAITLKAVRINVKMNQREAAKRIGISAETLSNYERGKSFPDIQTLQRIEQVYGVTYSDLIFLP